MTWSEDEVKVVGVVAAAGVGPMLPGRVSCVARDADAWNPTWPASR
jgi:hypothetical protein